MTDLSPDYFTKPVSEVDPEIAQVLEDEARRQETTLEMIASENFVPQAVLDCQGSVLTNKYAEGYPGRRYYGGCEVVDVAENLARDRAKELFGAEHVNVQPHAGAQANMAVYHALLERGDTVLGLSLDQGGHLTHGSPVNFSGQYYSFIPYHVDRETHLIDMDEVRSLAKEHRPRMIMTGATAYPRLWDFAAFREIADEVEAVLLVDAAHFIGLVAGKTLPNPLEYADIVTATTHKALRGPRGGMILSGEKYAEVIDKAVFPGGQGGPIESQIAAKAVCFHEASQPEFSAYTDQIVANAKAMAQAMMDEGVRVVSGGTDNHLFLVDLRSVDEDLTGRDAARMLDSLGITLNYNTIPNDPRPPFRASGLRIGTPAMTTQGMKEAEADEVARLIARALRHHDDPTALAPIESRVRELAAEFPPYPPDFPGHV